jgi:Tfp pilus assembly PilM family ATPase
MEKTGKGGRVAVLAASEKSISGLEAALDTAGMRAVVIEPIAINLWNALAGAIQDDGQDRLLFVARANELALALFRGDKPLFYRSKRISASHDLMQEIRLSISYLRNQVGIESLAMCWVAGDQIGAELTELIATELDAPVHRVVLEDVGISPGAANIRGEEIAVIAAMGVFAA